MRESNNEDYQDDVSPARGFEIDALLSQYESLRDEKTNLKSQEFRVLPATIGAIILLITYAFFREGGVSLLVVLPIIVGTIGIYVIVIEMWASRIAEHLIRIQKELPMDNRLSWEYRVETEYTGWAGFERSSVLTGGLLAGFYIGSLVIGLNVAANSTSEIVQQLPFHLIYSVLTLLVGFAVLGHVLLKRT